VLGRVASLLHIPYQDLTDAVARVPADSLLPVRVRRGLTLADVAKVEEWKLELPGVITEVEPQRVYPTSRFAAHLLGYVREAMDGLAGAVVVMDPRSGDILAMVSTPAFEIDRFTGTIDRDAWVRVVQDPNFPLLNRTIQTQYAPGSVFKILVAAAGLQEGSIT